jgi:hypothetical protein
MENKIVFRTRGDLDPLLKQTVHYVEANSFEMDLLKPHYERLGWKFIWEDVNRGVGYGIGQVDNIPVFINLRWARIDGVLVCFYTSESTIVDWRMVENWIDTNAPRYASGSRLKVDAQNFFNCLSTLEEIRIKGTEIVFEDM